LNEAIADLQKTTQAALRDQRRENAATSQYSVGELADETQAAINALAKGAAPRPAATTPTFTDNYSKKA